MLRVRRVSALISAVAAALLVLTTASTAAAAQTAAAGRIYGYIQVFSWGWLSSTQSNYCREDAIYSFAWKPYGDRVFIRDCKADGYGVAARVYYSAGNRVPGAYTGLKIHDPSAGGNGGWKGRGSIREHRRVMVVTWAYRSGDRNDRYKFGAYPTS